MNNHEKQLCEIFARLAHNSDQINIGPATTIAAMELDSLDILDATMKIQETFNVDIPYERFSQLNDIQSIARELEANS